MDHFAFTWVESKCVFDVLLIFLHVSSFFFFFFCFPHVFSFFLCFFSFFRCPNSSKQKGLRLVYEKWPKSNDSGVGQTVFSALVLFEAFFLFFFQFSFSVGADQHHQTEDKGEVAPPKGGGEGRQQLAKGELKTQHHPKKEAKQHHTTEKRWSAAPPQGREERQHLSKRERENSNTTQRRSTPTSTTQQKRRRKQPHPKKEVKKGSSRLKRDGKKQHHPKLKCAKQHHPTEDKGKSSLTQNTAQRRRRQSSTTALEPGSHVDTENDVKVEPHLQLEMLKLCHREGIFASDKHGCSLARSPPMCRGLASATSPTFGVASVSSIRRTWQVYVRVDSRGCRNRVRYSQIVKKPNKFQKINLSCLGRYSFGRFFLLFYVLLFFDFISFHVFPCFSFLFRSVCRGRGRGVSGWCGVCFGEGWGGVHVGWVVVCVGWVGVCEGRLGGDNNQNHNEN